MAIRKCPKCGEEVTAEPGEATIVWYISHHASGRCKKNQYEQSLKASHGDLDELLEAQAALQLKMPDGMDPRSMEEAEKAIFIKDMTLALTDELHELLSEVGWKPWASSRHVNTESARGELIDALHFFLNLALALDMDGLMIKEMYHAKHKKNQQRQEAGYDGVASKCGYCRRALDDEDKLLARGEEGCWLADDGNTGYCREARLQIVNDRTCECNSEFTLGNSVVHNDYMRSICFNGHAYLIPKNLLIKES